MRLYSINGKLVYKNLNKYRIKWDKSSKSKFQFKVKQFLQQYWGSDIVYEESPVYGTLLRVDFLNATRKIAIECDGMFHEEYSPFFHGKSRINYINSIKRDMKKEIWLEKNDFKVARIKENEIKELTYNWFNEKFGFGLV